MGTLHTVGRTDELPDGDSASVEVAGKRLAVFHCDGQFYAIDDYCPHAGAPLAGGYVENGIVTCPWHAWRFRLADGAWADNPRIKIGCYRVVVEGDSVNVELPDPPAPKSRTP